jgi:hypothetical protein
VGQNSAIKLRDRHGGTCFDCGRQRGQSLACGRLSGLGYHVDRHPDRFECDSRHAHQRPMW